MLKEMCVELKTKWAINKENEMHANLMAGRSLYAQYPEVNREIDE